MGHSILCRGPFHLVIPRFRYGRGRLAGAAVVRIVAAVSPWKSFAVCGRPAPARLKRRTSLWFNRVRNLCDIPDTRYPSGRDVAEIKAVYRRAANHTATDVSTPYSSAIYRVTKVHGLLDRDAAPRCAQPPLVLRWL